jgi:hypothetical protein
MIVITSKVHKAEIYAPTKNEREKIHLIKIYPDEEKLFCRPSSSVISYALAMKLSDNILGKEFDESIVYEI